MSQSSLPTADPHIDGTCFSQANKILAEADLSTFGHMCALHGKMVQLWAAGEAPTGHMLAQYNTLAAAFGLSGAWRGKVKPIGDKDEGNKFAKFKAPPAG